MLDGNVIIFGACFLVLCVSVKVKLSLSLL